MAPRERGPENGGAATALGRNRSWAGPARTDGFRQKPQAPCPRADPFIEAAGAWVDSPGPLAARGRWHVRSAEHLPWADASQYTSHERPMQFALSTYGEYWPGDATTHARQPPTCKNLDDDARRCCDTSTANALIHQRRHNNDFGVLR